MANPFIGVGFGMYVLDTRSLCSVGWENRSSRFLQVVKELFIGAGEARHYSHMKAKCEEDHPTKVDTSSRSDLASMSNDIAISRYVTDGDNIHSFG